LQDWENLSDWYDKKQGETGDLSVSEIRDTEGLLVVETSRNFLFFASTRLSFRL